MASCLAAGDIPRRGVERQSMLHASRWAYQGPFDVASSPAWTIVSVFAAVALTAGVVEEAALRGYMLSGIQRRFGWAGWLSLLAGVAAILAFRQLSRATALDRIEGSFS